MWMHSIDSSKLVVDKEWDANAGRIENFPNNIDYELWYTYYYREVDNELVLCGAFQLTNNVYVYIEFQQKEDRYIVVPVSNESMLDFFKPDHMKKYKISSTPEIDIKYPEDVPYMDELFSLKGCL